MQIKHLLTAFCLAFQGILAVSVYGAEQSSALTVTQQAEWTEEAFKANVTIEITGLSALDFETEKKQDEELNFSEEEVIEWKETIPGISLVYYLSDYFLPDKEIMPKDVLIEEIHPNGSDSQRSKTKITVPLSLDTSISSTNISIVIPIVLKEEYRDLEKDCTFPVSDESPIGDGQEKGVYLLQTDSMTCLAFAETASLETKGKKAQMQLSIQSASKNIKAGEILTYEITLANTGNTPLTEIRLQNNSTPENMTFYWGNTEGLSVMENGQEAILNFLDKDSTKKLTLSAEVPESQTENISYMLLAACQNPFKPKEEIYTQIEMVTPVTPLRVEFTVEKTADRKIAMPGDTIVYQICIRNTGERTLHSILSTERFQAADIPAVFVEKEGVRLNSYKNQALIPQIVPGEAFALEAKVTLPWDIKEQELLNEVSVVTQETGKEIFTSQSQILVQVPAFTPTPTPCSFFTPTLFIQSSSYKSGGVYGKSAASNPKTSDDAPILLWNLITGISAGIGIVCFCLWNGKRKH